MSPHAKRRTSGSTAVACAPTSVPASLRTYRLCARSDTVPEPARGQHLDDRGAPYPELAAISRKAFSHLAGNNACGAASYGSVNRRAPRRRRSPRSRSASSATTTACRRSPSARDRSVSTVSGPGFCRMTGGSCRPRTGRSGGRPSSGRPPSPWCCRASRRQQEHREGWHPDQRLGHSRGNRREPHLPPPPPRLARPAPRRRTRTDSPGADRAPSDPSMAHRHHA